MANWTILRAGNATGTNGGPGIGTGSVDSVPNVQAVTAAGVMNPVSGAITLTVSVTPPGPTGTFAGCHLYLELPDQSSSSAQVVGSTAVGGSAAVTGPWSVLDLGDFPYVAAEQPWTIQSPGSFAIDPTLDYPCRLYAASYSGDNENTLIQANQVNATPNVAFTLASLASGTPTAGTSITATSGPITAAVLPNDSGTGKLKTPIIVVVSSVPANIANWCYQLVLTYRSSPGVPDPDPTNPANQFAMTGLESNAGPVIAPQDGIPATHSFVIDTPTSPTSAIVWLQSGINDNGNFRANDIVPGITPSCPISFGVSTGTIDMGQAIQTSIDGTTITTGTGIMSVGVIGTANIADLNVTEAKIADEAVTDSKIANLSASKIFTGTLQIGGANAFLSVTNSGGQQIGWIGTVSIGGTAYNGAWFQQLRVGGANVQSAQITTDASGNVSIDGATLTLNLNNVTTEIVNQLVDSRVAGVYVVDNSYPSSTGTGTAVCPGYVGVAYSGGGAHHNVAQMHTDATSGAGYLDLMANGSDGAITIFSDATGTTRNFMVTGDGTVYMKAASGSASVPATITKWIEVYDPATQTLLGKIPIF
jgi:hypothetical protein